jgi:2-dehydropantoate 2-reductase
MKIVVLGAGAVGGYFGARLVQAGADVTFIVRPARLAQLQAQGLRIVSPNGDATLPVKAVLSTDAPADAELVLLTCKAYDLDSAMESIAPAMAGPAGVLPFLNGISHIETLERRFGAGRVVGGIARIGAALREDGAIEQFYPFNVLRFGELDGRPSARVTGLEAAFVGTTVDAKASPDIRRELWLKLVFLGTLAAVNSLLRANVGEILRAPEGGALLMRVFETNCAIAAREGHEPDEAFVKQNRALFSAQDSLLEASLLRDIERGGLIESDHLLGFLLERCRAHGLDDTLHAAAFAAAKAYEQRRAAGRLPRS